MFTNHKSFDMASESSNKAGVWACQFLNIFEKVSYVHYKSVWTHFNAKENCFKSLKYVQRKWKKENYTYSQNLDFFLFFLHLITEEKLQFFKVK